MNQDQKAKWEMTRAKGIWRYILMQWILKGMIPFLVLFSIAQYIGLFRAKIEFDEWLWMIPFLLFFYVLAGVMVWAWNETMYK